ncbi:MAG: AmmeMemoRadiSam system protein B [Candidatus Scalinduaceae bacterium]
MIRPPVVSGSFYPGSKKDLLGALKTLIDDKIEKQKVLGAISPHAGYMYSGKVMGSVFSRIEIPDTVIILAPNHTGYGSPYSIWPEGCWETPLGETFMDQELITKILNSCELLEKDEEAHIREHSVEVLLPFLQYINPQVKIVVIVIKSSNFDDLKIIGKSIGVILRKIRTDSLVIASSDMTHYESQQSANKKDKSAIAEIIALREEELYNVVQKSNITMCGICPVISMIVCSKERGAKKAELTRYTTSGDITGDYEQVVGYAGMIVE